LFIMFEGFDKIGGVVNFHPQIKKGSPIFAAPMIFVVSGCEMTRCGRSTILSSECITCCPALINRLRPRLAAVAGF
jgi:hypothetical protein